MQTQSYLSSEGVHHILELFMKSSSFTRYLLNDVLPRETFNNWKTMGSSLDELFEECESLIVSLKTFKQLHKVLNIGGKVAGVNSAREAEEYSKDKKKISMIPSKLIESFKVMKSLTINSDLTQFKPYYCELCDDSSHLILKANNHFSSKQHSTALISSAISYCSYQCDTCSLFIMAPQPVLKNIIDSAVHASVDDTIKILKNSKPFQSQLPLNEENVPVVSESQISNSKQQVISSPNNVRKELSSRSSNKHDAPITEVKEYLFSDNNKYEDNLSQKSAVVPTKKVFYMNKWFISPVFVEYTEKLLSEKLKDCFYCRPCDVGYISKGDWDKHKNDPGHLKFINDKGFRNACERCYNCPLEIIGWKPTVNVYLRYHNEKNHNIYRKMDYSSNQRSNNTKKTFNSSLNDDKRSLSDMSDRSSERYENRRRNYETEKSISSVDYAASLSSYPPSDVESNECGDKEQCEGDHDRPFYTSKHSFKCDNPLYISFIQALKEKRREYTETRNLPFKGVCLLCSSIVRDYFDWLEHITNFHVVKGENINKEKQCEECNTCVYGKEEFVINELWNIKEHNELDHLISKTI